MVHGDLRLAYGAWIYAGALTVHALDRPWVFFDMRWLVTDPASGDGVFSKTLTSTGSASSQEYFNPTERIQVATERAIQKTIRMLIATLHSLQG